MMHTVLLFFFNGEGFLGNEWLASAVSIAITYVVFVMGIPSLIFQTFIPEALRNIYNERFSDQWRNFFRVQLAFAIVLFLISDTKVYEILANALLVIIPENLNFNFIGTTITQNDCAEGIIALAVILIIVRIIKSGFNYLIKNFQTTRNISQQIAEKIAENAIRQFKLTQTIDEKDFDDLSTLAKELKPGQTKNQFLEECEKVIEYLLNQPPSTANSKIINRLLEDTVCLSITYDGGQSNHENRRKVLQILNLVNGHFPRNPNGYTTANGYDKTLIGYYFKKVGVAAMNHDDTASAIEVIEQLYTIDADPKEIFFIGNQAFRNNNHKITIAAIHKLKSKSINSIQQINKITAKEKRMIYNWIGLMAKMYQRGGSSAAYAGRHWNDLKQLSTAFQLHAADLAAEAYQFFYRLTDFETADAVRYLEQNQP